MCYLEQHGTTHISYPKVSVRPSSWKRAPIFQFLQISFLFSVVLTYNTLWHEIALSSTGFILAKTKIK